MDRNVTMGLCDHCFEELTGFALATIHAGFTDKRLTICETCERPLVRLSNIIESVGWCN